MQVNVRTYIPVPYTRVKHLRNRIQKVYLTAKDREALSQGIATSILRCGSIDELEIAGYTFVFSGDISRTNRTIYTGVEYMGKKESYTVPDYHVNNLNLEGVYTKDGESIKSQIETTSLCYTINELLEKQIDE